MVYISVFPYLIRNDVRAKSLEEAQSICFHLRAIELKLRYPGHRIEMKNLETFREWRCHHFSNSFQNFHLNWFKWPVFGSLILIPFHKGNRIHVPKHRPLPSIETKNWKRWRISIPESFYNFSSQCDNRGFEAWVRLLLSERRSSELLPNSRLSHHFGWDEEKQKNKPSFYLLIN